MIDVVMPNPTPSLGAYLLTRDGLPAVGGDREFVLNWMIAAIGRTDLASIGGKA